LKAWVAVTAFLPLLWGCEVDHGGKVMEQNLAVTDTENVSHETFALGTQVTSQGAVPQDAAGETFVRGGEVFLSVDLSGASTDPVVEVKWIGPEDELLRRDVRRARQGMHHVSFSSGATARWPPGTHRAVILIDGRSVSEKRFTVM
jgi:hypothetical protein